MAKKSGKSKLIVEAIRHEDASRKNIPTAEYESVMEETAKYDVRVAYERRNRDLDPEQVKAFRDTWRDGINSYLTYLRDRFISTQRITGQNDKKSTGIQQLVRYNWLISGKLSLKSQSLSTLNNEHVTMKCYPCKIESKALPVQETWKKSTTLNDTYSTSHARKNE